MAASIFIILHVLWKTEILKMGSSRKQCASLKQQIPTCIMLWAGDELMYKCASLKQQMPTCIMLWAGDELMYK